MHFNLEIRSSRILTPEGIFDGSVYILDDKIYSCQKTDSSFSSDKLIEAGNHVVMPGLIDPHVHINEPGRTDWEGFDTATRSAAAGGITTLVDMPLNSTPVTTTADNFQKKIESAKKYLHVNCGFWGGVIPDNLDNIEKLLSTGILGLKTFLTHSGIDDFPETSPELLRNVLLQLKKHHMPLLVHCELDDKFSSGELNKNPTSYQAYLSSRPREWENKAINAMINLCRETQARVHIVHLSSSEALSEITDAKKEGLPLTVETAPHYLFFCAEEIEDKETILKCAPPIREKENNEKLWKALKRNIIDFIATDHSPAPPELKEVESGNFEKAWGGIAGLQFSLPVIWTEGKDYDITLSDICKWMCEHPAKFLRLEMRKGKIKKDFDADIVIWDPDKEIILRDKDIYHRHKISPYAGLKLKGQVRQTIINGKIVFDRNNFIELNSGRILLSN
jgi:allantoinase